LAVVATGRAAPRATVVLTEHDVPPEKPDHHLRLSKSLTDRCAHAVVAVSRRNAARRRSYLGAPAERFAAILNGVTVPDLPPGLREANRRRVRQACGLAEEAVVLGSVVRLAEGKGLHDLLQAMALVLDEYPCELLLVGDGPLRQELEALADRLRIAEHVHFAGHHVDPAPFMDAMDVFVLAVPAGSMSIALLEAMARGVPPVITFCGPEEAVIPEHTGLGAPPCDPRGLADALLRMAREPALRGRLGHAAACHVRRHFSVGRVADDLMSIYTSARYGRVPARLRADAPPNPYPGGGPDGPAFATSN
jgi:glycosyltransferase involved in cell wall biosynthesis